MKALSRLSKTQRILLAAAGGLLALCLPLLCGAVFARALLFPAPRNPPASLTPEVVALQPTSTLTRTASPTATARPATATQIPTATPTSTPIPRTAAPTPTTGPTAPPGELAAVVRVLDGDTIEVNLAGVLAIVRYIGVDTPEFDQPCGAEAAAFNASLVAGQTVRLLRDVSEADPSGRLLRYVFVGDRLVNAELVRHGYARAINFPPDTSLAGFFEFLESEARIASLACYGAGIFDALPTFIPTLLP